MAYWIHMVIISELSANARTMRSRNFFTTKLMCSVCGIVGSQWGVDHLAGTEPQGRQAGRLVPGVYAGGWCLAAYVMRECVCVVNEWSLSWWVANDSHKSKHTRPPLPFMASHTATHTHWEIRWCMLCEGLALSLQDRSPHCLSTAGRQAGTASCHGSEGWQPHAGGWVACGRTAGRAATGPRHGPGHPHGRPHPQYPHR